MIFFTFSRSGNVAKLSPKPRKPINESDGPLNKQALAAAVASLRRIPRKEIEQILTAFFEVLAETLKDGRPVVISGFGRFRPRQARAHGCRNPLTGQKIVAPKRKSITFRPSSALKKALA